MYAEIQLKIKKIGIGFIGLISIMGGKGEHLMMGDSEFDDSFSFNLDSF